MEKRSFEEKKEVFEKESSSQESVSEFAPPPTHIVSSSVDPFWFGLYYFFSKSYLFLAELLLSFTKDPLELSSLNLTSEGIQFSILLLPLISQGFLDVVTAKTHLLRHAKGAKPPSESDTSSPLKKQKVLLDDQHQDWGLR